MPAIIRFTGCYKHQYLFRFYICIIFISFIERIIRIRKGAIYYSLGVCWRLNNNKTK